METTPVAPEKLVVIPGGIRLDEYDVPNINRERIRSEWGIEGPTVVIGCVSRIDEQKGLMDVVEAFAKLVVRIPSTRLVFVGEPTIGEPAFSNQLHQRIDDLALTGKIIFAGYRADIPNVLSAFDIFILPSYEESFGYVFIEAMAAGLPVIATNTGGVPEIVDDGTSGILVTPRNVAEIYEAIERLVENGELRKQFGAAGRKRVETHFREQQVIERVEKEYRRLIDRRYS